MRNQRKRKSNAGVTLIEMLVVVTIIALFATLVAPGMRRVRRGHAEMIPPGGIGDKRGSHAADRLHSPRMDPLDHLDDLHGEGD